MIGRTFALGRAAGGRALLFDHGPEELASVLVGGVSSSETDELVARIAGER
jgi:hypothetical protein